jgi:periplasmic divalent cation tolerance protein
MVRLIFTTFATAEEATAVVRTLVEEHLAACGTILPGARSIYLWQGAIEEAAEAVVLLKTTADRCPALRERLLALHPYETPECLTVNPDEVAPAYAAWIHRVAGDSPTP